jgi:adenylate kinase
VNTYDPANSIVYRHMNPRSDLYAASVTSTHTINRLPVGYMNGSPRTCLTTPFARAA